MSLGLPGFFIWVGCLGNARGDRCNRSCGGYQTKTFLRRTTAFFFSLILLFAFVSQASGAGYSCPTYKKYTSCAANTYISNCPTSSSSWTGQTISTSSLTVQNSCKACPTGYTCAGGLVCPKARSITCSAGYYLKKGATTCTACGGNAYYCKGGTFTYSATSDQGRSSVSSGYYTTGGSSTTRTGQSQCNGAVWCSGGVQNNCPNAPTNWTRASGTGWTSYSSCYIYRNATSISSYCNAGQLQRKASSSTAYSSTATETTAFKAKAGSYVTGSGANMTCKECTGTTYSTGGDVHACTACPAASGRSRTSYPSNYYNPTLVSISNQNWGSDRTSVETCVAKENLRNSRGQFSVESVRYNPDTDKYDLGGGPPYYGSVNPGYYVKTRLAETYCETGVTGLMYYKDAQPCPTGSYCPGLTSMPLCSSGEYTETNGIYICPSTYASSAAQSTSINACYLNTTAGKYVATAGAGQVTCLAGGYCAGGTKVFYNGTGGRVQCTGATYAGTGASQCSDCPGGYTANTTAGKTTANQCQMNVPGGKYIATQNSSTQTTCTAGYACPGGILDYGDIGIRNQCLGATYSDAGAASCTSCLGADETNLFDPSDFDVLYGYWNDNVSNIITQYGYNALVYVPCQPNTRYTVSGHTGAVGMRVGTTSVTPAFGVAVSGSVVSADTHSATIVTPPDAKYLVVFVLRDGDNANSSNKEQKVKENTAHLYIGDGYTVTGDSATDHAGAASCKITCGPGQYSPTAGSGCQDVGAGYWGAGGVVAQTATLARTQCTGGLTTIGYGAGADESGDCGRVLNVGDGKLYLRSGKKTELSLNVKIGDTTYYGNMSTGDKYMSDGITRRLKINVGGTEYSVYDDSVSD